MGKAEQGPVTSKDKTPTPTTHINSDSVEGIKGLSLGDKVKYIITGKVVGVSEDQYTKGRYNCELQIASGSIKKISDAPKDMPDEELDGKLKEMKDED